MKFPPVALKIVASPPVASSPCIVIVLKAVSPLAYTNTGVKSTVAFFLFYFSAKVASKVNDTLPPCASKVEGVRL